MTPKEFFARLAALRFLDELRGVNATYRYDIEGAGRWRVTVHDGKIEVATGGGSADCTLFCDAADFVDIVLGKRNVVTTLMQGRIGFDGPIPHLIVMTNLMRLDDMKLEERPKELPRPEVRP